jgi:hypothetical protein
MEVTHLARVLAALEKTDIAELRWEEPDWSLALTRLPLSPARPGGAPTISADDGVSAPVSSNTPVRDYAPLHARLVKAGMPGRFLESHPAVAEAIAATSLRDGTLAVQKHALLGLLQIGVLLLPVDAPEDGVIDACLVASGDAVGFGTPLFSMTGAPDGAA